MAAFLNQFYGGETYTMNLLKFKPSYKDYIWGGTKLNNKYGKKSGFEKTAESWELSVHPDGESIICGGEYDGIALSEYIKKNSNILGNKVCQKNSGCKYIW